MSSEDPCLPKTSRFASLFTTTGTLESNQPLWSTPAGSLDKIRFIHSNGISANTAYQPHNTLQLRGRTNSGSLLSMPSKIDIEISGSSPHEIPVYEYGKDFLSDPILFVESVREVGRKYGAVKVKMPPGFASQFQTDHQINPELFLFRTNRVLNNPMENELYSRLKFYNELIRFHTDIHTPQEEGLENIENTGTDALLPRVSEPSVPVVEGVSEPIPVVSQVVSSIPEAPSGVAVSIPEPVVAAPNGGPVADVLAQAIKTEDSENLETGNHVHRKVPIFLAKVPTMDNRPLDLYDLFRFVIVRGGYDEVINKKLWAQIGRELGFTGETTGNISTWLKLTYAQILFPFEMHLGDRKFDIASLAKRNSESDLRAAKRQKLNSQAPLVLGSAKEFLRSIRLKASKGFLLNEPHLMDIKPLLVLAVKDTPSFENGNEPKKKEELITPLSATAQVNHFIKWLSYTLSNIQDSSRYVLTPKYSSSYTLKLYMDKDSNFQKYLVASYPEYFGTGSADNKTWKIPIEEYERLYWEFTSHKGETNLLDGMKLECGTCIPNSLVGSAFYRLGDEFASYKEQIGLPKVPNNGGVNVHDLPGDFVHNNAGANSHQNGVNDHDGPSTIHKALHPFSIHNIPILPNSLLGAYSSHDVNNRDLVNSTLSIGMTFSTENWKCEDHFTQQCNFNFVGAGKRWYFIPELDFEKFEALVTDVVKTNSISEDTSRVNLNYKEKNWHFDQLARTVSSDNDLEYDFLLKSLESMVNPYPNIRVDHKSDKFQGLINIKRQQRSDISLNQEFLITPELLREKGINFTTTVQQAGEYILKFPKTYSCQFSLGLNLSEEVNFASSLWLDYAEEGEGWLAKQGILPNILVFRMLVNFAQLFEASDLNSIHFDAEIYDKILVLYLKLLDRELSLRSRLREAIKIKETTIEERNVAENDSISDDTLQNAFPSKIVVTEVSTHQQFIMTLDSFLQYLTAMEKDEDSVQDIINDDDYAIELQMMYSDEKLRNYLKLLRSYSVDYESWLTNYEQVLKSDEEVSMKTYKSLLSDGWKIYSALSSSNDTFRRFVRGARPESSELTAKVNMFKEEIENLQKFVDESTELIEDCQSILSLKHQQRIRGGDQTPQLNNEQQTGNLQLLLELVNKIPKVNFYTPEFDQIFEFKNEIENFDRACRTLIQKPNASISELNDMISLGTSFGVHIPSLKFLRRLRDRQRWLETYKIIISGGDPFSGKKDIFSLKDMIAFRDEGLQVLASEDVDKIRTIDEYVVSGNAYDAKVSGYLLQNSVLNNVDLKKLDSIIEDMVERSKNPGTDRLFVTLDTYSKLLDLKAQAGLIEFLCEYPTKTHKLFDITQTLGELDACGFKYDGTAIQNDISNAHEWIDTARNLLKSALIVNHSRSKPRLPPQTAKHATHPDLIKTAVSFFNKCATAFAGEDVDNFTKSSSWMFLKNMEFVADEKHPARYCMCRDYEDGVMVECDRCHEWYHVSCTNATVEEDENTKYSCPVCLAMDAYKLSGKLREIPGRISEHSLSGLIARGESLRIVPQPELELLKSIVELVKRLTEYFETQQKTDLNVGYGPLYLIFVSRKFYGSPVTNMSMLQKLFDSWKNVNVPVLFKSDLREATVEATEPNVPTYPVTLNTKKQEQPTLAYIQSYYNLAYHNPSYGYNPVYGQSYNQVYHTPYNQYRVLNQQVPFVPVSFPVPPIPQPGYSTVSNTTTLFDNQGLSAIKQPLDQSEMPGILSKANEFTTPGVHSTVILTPALTVQSEAVGESGNVAEMNESREAQKMGVKETEKTRTDEHVGEKDVTKVNNQTLAEKTELVNGEKNVETKMGVAENGEEKLEHIDNGDKEVEGELRRPEDSEQNVSSGTVDAETTTVVSEKQHSSEIKTEKTLEINESERIQ